VYGSFIGSPTLVEGQLVGTNNQTSSVTVFNDVRHQLKGGYTPSWNLASGLNYSVTDNLILGFRAGRTYLNDKGGSYDVPIGTPLYNIVVPCDPNNDACPDGFSCLGDGTGGGVCWLGGSSGGCCETGHGDSRGSILFGLAFAAVWITRRRK